MKKIPTDSQLDAKLLAADPAKGKRAPKLDSSLLERAAAKDSGLSLTERIQSLGRSTKAWLQTGAVTASAAAVVAAVVLSSTPQPLIQLSSGQGGPNAETSAGMSLSMDKMMWMPQIFEYQAGAGLSNESGNGTVYKLVRSGDPEVILEKVAAVMGVKGEVKKYPEFSEENPGYFFSNSNEPWSGTEPTVSIWWNGTGSWYYSNPVAYPESKCETTDKDGNCSAWTEIKPTPDLLPSRQEAIAKAIEVFSATGLEVSEQDLRVYMDEWGVNIMSSLKVDGVSTSIEWYIGWSSNGQLSYAGGHSVAVENMGTFDTISPVAAVERLSDWRWSGSPSPIYYERYQGNFYGGEAVLRNDEVSVSPDTPVTSDGEQGTSGSSGEGSEPASPPAVDPSAEPAPQPSFEPEVVKLTIESSEATLLTIWDANGDVWLVPGYIMVNNQGWFSAVIALIEGIIALPEPVEYDIMPMPAEDSSVSNK